MVTAATNGKVTSKSILSPLQNVWLVALEVKVTLVVPTVVTVIEFVEDSQARGSSVTEF